MSKSIWLSYDLGVGGDYRNLYAWLDDHGAINCGTNVAFVKLNLDNGVSDEELKKAIVNDISKHVKLQPGNKLYVVRSFSSDDEMGTKGSFVYGKRSANPWEGYGTSTLITEEEG